MDDSHCGHSSKEAANKQLAPPRRKARAATGEALQTVIKFPTGVNQHDLYTPVLNFVRIFNFNLKDRRWTCMKIALYAGNMRPTNGISEIHIMGDADYVT